jgi:asparagine synthase (glutamine-hydrolysing)
VGAGGVERGSYFDPNAAAMEACEDASALAARAREMVCGAVRKQLVADVPVGCFLSGGVDSSIIAAAMKSAVGKDQRVLTFSIGFDDARYDETAYAAEVARHLGTEHREFRVRANAAEDLPKIAAAFEEPFGDSSALPTHYLARETRKHVKVALSGDGGDELFGGYDRYRAMRLAERLGSFGRGFVQSVAPLLRWMSSHPKSRAARLRRFSESLHLRPTWRYGSYLRLFDTEALQQLLKPHVMDLKICYQAENWIALRFGDTRADVAEAAMAVDRVTYLPGDLLTKVDRCSMMYALEVRSPFMDHELVRWAAGLPARVLFDGRPKRLLRLGFEKDLPASVFRRKKMGFAVPIGDWFCGELRDTLRDALFSSGSFAEGYFERAALERMIAEHESRAVDHSQRLYGLLMLELWWKGRT